MARIDVDDIIEDPDFEDDDFEVIRSVETVGTDGRALFLVQAPFASAGVVQPAAGRSLMMLPEGARIQGSIDIWTKEPLRMNDGTYAADVICWHGRSYVVSNVEDFLNYGAGYVRATCTLHKLTEGPEKG
jgi:hypothetical protein